jgi:hypothetical protein
MNISPVGHVEAGQMVFYEQTSMRENKHNFCQRSNIRSSLIFTRRVLRMVDMVKKPRWQER